MVGLQIYTVRSLLTDFESCKKALKKIKDIGYDHIQLSGGIDYADCVARAALDVGISVVGYLTSADALINNYDDVVRISRLCGASDIGVSGFETTEGGAREFAKAMNKIAAKLKGDGFTFSYHNHSLEFLRTECQKTVMDILLEEFDPELVYLMPDTYWLQHGGVDVRDFIEKHASRVKILHLKDMKRTKDGVTFAEVSVGNINMSGIIALAKKARIGIFTVEQDSCDADPLVSAKISFENTMKLLGE